MLSGRFVFVASMLAVVHVIADQPVRAETTSEAVDVQTPNWPPHWLAGLWKNKVRTITCDGQPSDKSFALPSHYVFTSGFRFTFYPGRVRATPMIGQTQRDDVLHCLFKMTNNRPAMRAEFTHDGENARYISYLVSISDRRRYKLDRQLIRETGEVEVLKRMKTALAKEFASPHSTSAREILEKWIEDRERSLEAKQ